MQVTGDTIKPGSVVRTITLEAGPSKYEVGVRTHSTGDIYYTVSVSRGGARFHALGFRREHRAERYAVESAVTAHIRSTA